MSELTINLGERERERESKTDVKQKKSTAKINKNLKTNSIDSN